MVRAAPPHSNVLLLVAHGAQGPSVVCPTLRDHGLAFPWRCRYRTSDTCVWSVCCCTLIGLAVERRLHLASRLRQQRAAEEQAWLPVRSANTLMATRCHPLHRSGALKRERLRQAGLCSDTC